MGAYDHSQSSTRPPHSRNMRKVAHRFMKKFRLCLFPPVSFSLFFSWVIKFLVRLSRIQPKFLRSSPGSRILQHRCSRRFSISYRGLVVKCPPNFYHTYAIYSETSQTSRISFLGSAWRDYDFPSCVRLIPPVISYGLSTDRLKEGFDPGDNTSR